MKTRLCEQSQTHESHVWLYTGASGKARRRQCPGVGGIFEVLPLVNQTTTAAPATTWTLKRILERPEATIDYADSIVVSTPFKKPLGWFWSFSEGRLEECNEVNQRGRRDLYPRD